MAHYLVKAKLQADLLASLKAELESGEVRAMRPFGRALDHALQNARLVEPGWAVWEEEDYCSPPLAMERAAVLDRYFTHITVEPVAEDEGWKQIAHLPRLWENADAQSSS